jgi:isopenicillin-N epimerase
VGTNDPTAWLATPAALDFMDALGWDRVRAHNHALVRLGRDIVAAALETSTDDVPDAAIGSMAIVPLPIGSLRSDEDAASFSTRLLAEHRVEVPGVWWNGRSFLRLSAQVYNAPTDYERLAEALASLVESPS